MNLFSPCAGFSGCIRWARFFGGRQKAERGNTSDVANTLSRGIAVILAVVMTGCGEPESDILEFTVVADQVAASSVPTLDQIAPYDEALTVSAYRISQLISGPRSAPKEGSIVRVAHWSVVAGKDQPPLENPGQPREMKVTPLDSIRGLDKVYRRNDLAFDPEETIYLDLSQSLANAEPPKQVRYDYRGTVSTRMENYWRIRHQLRLAVIGNSHAGVGVNPRQFFQPENETVPVAINLSVAGSELPMQRLMAEAYLSDLPKLEWIVWGVSPRSFNQRHAFDRREEIFRSSPGFVFDEANRDKLWPVDSTVGVVSTIELKEEVDNGMQPWGWSPARRRELPVPITPEATKTILSKCSRDHFRWNEEAWSEFQKTVESVAEKGARLLLFTPPYHPLVFGSDAVDFNGTGVDDYRDIVARLEALAATNDHVVFLDIHRGGEHGLSHEDFANPDHLYLTGSEKLTARLVKVIESMGP